MQDDASRQAGQPRERRGTVGHPYSALNLRFVLASFGLVFSTILAVVLALIGQPVFAVTMAVVAVTAAVDLAILIRRRRERRRQHPDRRYSLFE
jgi:hypothetical protein